VLQEVVAELAAGVALPVTVQPDAGVPRCLGRQVRYARNTGYFAEASRRFAASGATLVGGCCGTTPAKLAGFRGESRFTTWACKFVILEVSTKLGRHFWLRPSVALDGADWDWLPDRFGTSPADHAERQDLIAAARRAVEEELTERQRRVFIAIAVNGVPAARWCPCAEDYQGLLLATRTDRA
jgi:Homocysteine S-methyltransferase